MAPSDAEVSGLAHRSESAKGHVVAVRGAVVDVAFPPGRLPAVNDALEVAPDPARRIVLESIERYNNEQ